MNQIDTVRDIGTVTGELRDAQRRGGEAIIDIGRRLIEAKALLEHGQWLNWLNEQAGYSERMAQNFMRVSREYSNPQLVADLGVRKALSLLALPEPEREEFIAENHVEDMTARELEKAIRERDEARKAAERVADLEKQLAELKAAPVDVAVMAVDQEAIDKAKAEAVAELQAKLDKAQEAKKKSDEKRKHAEAVVDTLKLQLEEAAKAKQQAAAMADPDRAEFKAYYEQLTVILNKMGGMLLKARNQEDQTNAQGFTKIMLAVKDQAGRYAQ